MKWVVEKKTEAYNGLVESDGVEGRVSMGVGNEGVALLEGGHVLEEVCSGFVREDVRWCGRKDVRWCGRKVVNDVV